MADAMPIQEHRYFADGQGIEMAVRAGKDAPVKPLGIIACERCAAVIPDTEQHRKQHVQFHIHTDMQARSIVSAGEW